MAGTLLNSRISSLGRLGFMLHVMAIGILGYI